MVNKYQELSGDVEALEAAMEGCESKQELRRYQAVYLRLKHGMKAEEIGEITCFGKEWVLRLHGLYRREGLAGLAIKPKGGRYHEMLSVEAEKEFIGAFQEEAAAGGLLEVSRVHRALEEKVGRPVVKSVTYKMLHRHGWRKVAPKPQHPKADIEAQAALKKMASAVGGS